MMTAHPLEISFLCAACIALVGWVGLVYLKIKDINDNQENGPIRFMLNDNRRRGSMMAAWALIFVRMSYAAISRYPDRLQYLQAGQSLELMCWMNVLAYGLILEAFFTYRRREKMAYLIAKYAGVKGGKRYTDPPADPKTQPNAAHL